MQMLPLCLYCQCREVSYYELGFGCDNELWLFVEPSIRINVLEGCLLQMFKFYTFNFVRGIYYFTMAMNFANIRENEILLSYCRLLFLWYVETKFNKNGHIKTEQ